MPNEVKRSSTEKMQVRAQDVFLCPEPDVYASFGIRIAAASGAVCLLTGIVVGFLWGYSVCLATV